MGVKNRGKIGKEVVGFF